MKSPSRVLCLGLVGLAAILPMAPASAMPASEAQVARTFYVATSGSDANDGLSTTRPFQHIQQCARVMMAGDTCLVGAGIYRETIKPARSGVSGAPIVFEPYAGEPVTITGSDVVSSWSHYQGHIYRARVSVLRQTTTPADNQVFVDGSMMSAAQWPRARLDPMSPTEAVAGPGTNARRICDPRLSIFPAHFWRNALLHVWAGYGWWASNVFVTDSGVGGGCGAGVGYVSFPLLPETTGPGFDPLPRNPYYLLATTAAQALAAHQPVLNGAGQFFFDGAYLYIWTPNGDTPAAHRVEIRQRDYAFDLSGRSYISLGSGNKRGFRLFAATVATSAGSNHDILDGLDVQYPSHFAALTRDQSRTLTNGNDDHVDSGVLLAGSYDQLINSRINMSAGNGVALAGDHALVQNNLITNVDYAAGAGVGVYGQDWEHNGLGATDSDVNHNTIHDTGMAGIAMPALHNSISYNNIYRTGKLTNDVGGGFLSDWYYGPGCVSCGSPGQGGAGSLDARSVFAYNWVHDNLDTTARSNTFCPNPSKGNCASASAGIYLDISAGPWIVHHNVVWGETYADLVLNGNAFDFGGVSGSPYNLIYNNTLASTTPGVLSASAVYEDSVMTGTVLMNNIFVAPATITIGKNPPLLSNNMRNTSQTEFAASARHDYHLRAGSSLIGKGRLVAGIGMGQGPGHVDPGAYATSGGGPNQNWGPPGCQFSGCQGN